MFRPAIRESIKNHAIGGIVQALGQMIKIQLAMPVNVKIVELVVVADQMITEAITLHKIMTVLNLTYQE
jgi:hypothetical protein